MKKLSVLSLLVLFVSIVSYAQEQVKWSYVAKKVKDKTYEVRLIATIPSGWYIYAQAQPEESISQPTTISFAKNPLLNISDKPFAEQGQVIRKRYPGLGYVANTYQDTVQFVQLITVKSDVKTNLLGTVRFQACNDHMCMPPEDEKFTLMLQ